MAGGTRLSGSCCCGEVKIRVIVHWNEKGGRCRKGAVSGGSTVISILPQKTERKSKEQFGFPDRGWGARRNF